MSIPTKVVSTDSYNAIQYDGTNINEIIQFFKDNIPNFHLGVHTTIRNCGGYVRIQTMWTTKDVWVTDVIVIKNERSGHFIYTEDQFNQKFADVSKVQ